MRAAVDVGVRPCDPVGEEVEFGLAADEAVGLEQRVGVGDEGFGWLGDVTDVVERRKVWLAVGDEAVYNEAAQVFR